MALVGALPHAAAQTPALAAGAVAPPSIASRVTPGDINPDNLLLFELNLRSLTLTDGLAAYGDPADPMIPIGELTRLLELNVDVLPGEARIVGHVGESQRSILLDIRSGVARNGPRSVEIAASDTVVTATEIYLRASAVERLLPVSLVINAEALTIALTPLELLPIESRLQRQQRSGQVGQGGPAETVLRVETPYRRFSPPAFDINLGAGVQSASPHLLLRYDVRAAADLFSSNFLGYLGSDEHGDPNVARATLERRSVNGGLLGPLNARVVSAGDVYTPGLAIGPRSIAGRGVAFSTAPLDQTSIFNRVDLRGELPLGYDVELYVNDVLVQADNTPEQGRYQFLGVPLSAGINIVRIVTYGPRGERKEDTRVINVSGGLLGRGEATLQFGAVDQDEPLFRLDNFQAVAGREVFTRGRRIVANVNYGLSQYLTLSAGAATYAPRPGLQQDLVTVGARTSLLGFATQFDIAANGDGGRGAILGVAGQVMGVTTVLRHAEYRGDFIDETNIAADLLRFTRRRTEVNVDGSLKIGGGTVPVSLRAFRDEYADGANRLIFFGRVSSALRGVLYTTGLDYSRIDNPAAPPLELLSGFFALSAYRGYTWQIRGMLNYDFLPDPKARDVSLTVDREVSEDFAVRFGISQRLDTGDGQSLFVSSIRRTRRGDLALTGEYDNASDAWRVGVQWNFGLAWKPNDREYAITRPGPGTGGSVMLQAFMDANGDGVFNAGEAPVPNVTVDNGQRLAVTGVDGRAFLTGSGAAPLARVSVSLDRIENGMFRSPPSVVEFTPRPGAVTTIPYPIQPTGEVVVRMLLRRPDGERVGLSAVQVLLVNERGGVRDAISEFDGSVIFQELPVGRYRLQLAPEQAVRLRMSLVQPVTVIVRGDGEASPDVAAEVAFQER